MLIPGRLIANGEWIVRPGCTTFDLYRPPRIKPGDPKKACPWLDHICLVYPEAGPHILQWLAQRVQRPEIKINHALVLGGNQGVGKDTILEPVKHAVGPWNLQEASPPQTLGRFSAFVKSVVLRVSEARDLGDANRYAFYDHLKALTAAPPDALSVDEKHIRAYSVFNVCGVVITSNHRTNDIHLPADDRRHYVAWSEKTKEGFEEGYWSKIYGRYAAGGNEHVAAYLADLDISVPDPYLAELEGPSVDPPLPVGSHLSPSRRGRLRVVAHRDEKAAARPQAPMELAKSSLDRILVEEVGQGVVAADEDVRGTGPEREDGHVAPVEEQPPAPSRRLLPGPRQRPRGDVACHQAVTSPCEPDRLRADPGRDVDDQLLPGPPETGHQAVERLALALDRRVPVREDRVVPGSQLVVELATVHGVLPAVRRGLVTTAPAGRPR